VRESLCLSLYRFILVFFRILLDQSFCADCFVVERTVIGKELFFEVVCPCWNGKFQPSDCM